MTWISGSLILALGFIVLIVFILIIVTLAIAAMQKRRKSMIGEDEMINEEGIARTRIDPEGDVFVKSELWKARCDKCAIAEGENVVVKGRRGLTLIVEKKV